MKPFLLLATRAEDAAADGEYEAMVRYSGLRSQDLHRVRLEQALLGAVELEQYSGLILGGGPFNVTDPDHLKSPVQQRVEAELLDLSERVLAQDFPFLGACYGIGTIGVAAGGVVDRSYSEPIGAVPVTLTAAGVKDPVFQGLSPTFDAFVGHKEAIRTLPEGAVLLASSPACPVQAFRMGQHVYATQFHPELDVAGLELRIDVYQHFGYFEPAESEALKARARASSVNEPGRILANFVRRYARD